MDKKELPKDETKECCSTRTVLWILVFIGFGVNYMTRINLNIAIVSMVKPRPKNNVSFTSECLVENLPFPGENTSFSSINFNETSTETSLITNTHSPLINKTTETHFNELFDWDEKVQGQVLGSYFWLHWLTQIPGGIFGGKYGTKAVFGLSNLFGVLLCFAMPWAAHTSPYYLIFLRTLQGLICGFSWPSMHNMTASWIPPNERSKFVSAYLGSSVGVAVTYPLCGWLIDLWGWPSVFHVCGIIGTTWFVFWWWLVHDSPAKHPRISDEEKDYILTSLGSKVAIAKERAPVPWKSIMTNMTVWANILAQWGGVWGMFTLMTHTPTYFKFIHGWNIRATGFLSGMPHFFRWLWAYTFSILGDYLLRSNKMSRTNVRKLATAVCCIGQGFFMLALAYSGCNRIAAVVFLTMATASHGAVSTGPLASVVDISPNYAGIILGVIGTIVSMAGFIIPAIVGYLTFQNQTVGQWQKVFWIASALLFSSGIFFVCFAKSELQSWNNPYKAKDIPESELVILKNKSKEKSKADLTNGYEKTEIDEKNVSSQDLNK